MEWLKANYGRVSVASMQEFFASHYFCDEEGRRMDYFRDPKSGKWLSAKYSGYSTCQHDPYTPAYEHGTKDVTIYELGQKSVRIYQAAGRPCEWDGPWDEFTPFGK